MSKKVILVYTELGFAGSYVVHPPISLVYISTKIVLIPDLEIEILDCRIQKDWKEILQNRIQEEDILLVGFFVMSGLQVFKAYEVSDCIKGMDIDIPIVWGGPHPTILPEEVLNYDVVDYCVRGFGTDAFTELVKNLLSNSKNFENVPNLCYEKDNENHIGNINDAYEKINYKDLPYHLLDPIIESYYIGTKSRAFPIYTAFGCPYQCNFCITPIWFENSNKKWDPLPAKEVVDHIEFLRNKWGVEFFYLWDDDSFVAPSHFSGIASELLERKIDIQIGVRGIRANEVERMKPHDFKMLEKVGVSFLHIGVENGSQRLLDLMEKGITVEQAYSANKKLAQYKNISPMYNMLIGIPTETIEELRETGLFMLHLSEENPNCIIHPPNMLIPYPGGEAYNLAIKEGYVPPNSPEEWRDMDQEGEIDQPWYTKQTLRYIEMLRVAAYSLSNWSKVLKEYPLWLRIFASILTRAYRPIAKYRIRNYQTNFLFEHSALIWIQSALKKISRAS